MCSSAILACKRVCVCDTSVCFGIRVMLASQSELEILLLLQLFGRVSEEETSPEYSLEGLMLKQKFQCFGHHMERTDSLKKTLMLGKIEIR